MTAERERARRVCEREQEQRDKEREVTGLSDKVVGATA